MDNFKATSIIVVGLAIASLSLTVTAGSNGYEVRVNECFESFEIFQKVVHKNKYNKNYYKNYYTTNKGSCKGYQIDVIHNLRSTSTIKIIKEATKISDIGIIYKKGIVDRELCRADSLECYNKLSAPLSNIFVTTAWAFPVHDFEEGSDENQLNGSSGGTGWDTNWSCDTLFLFETTGALEGAVSVDVVDDGADSECTRDLTEADDEAIWYLRFRPTTNTQRAFVQARRASGGNQHSIEFRTTGQISVIDNLTQTNIQAYSGNTTYIIETRFRYSVEEFEFRVDEGSWSVTYNLRDYTNLDHTTGTDSFRIVATNSGTYMMDDYQDSTLVVGGEAIATTTALEITSDHLGFVELIVLYIFIIFIIVLSILYLWRYSY